ncbi:DNA mismatch repair endonuclease MutL [Candidatus Dojkabacteria bacterium]|nr:DNA mismatch repair endonuclease MutL [Candidatus Dojkabacteria bacterium]
MSKIHLLDRNLIDKIAAGEVVERPASVVKELLENAIDSGATKISLRIKNGGIDLIEVIDNGSGISKEDLEIAVDAHTTSKIYDIEDLNNILTLGFRGEALASISSVSNLSILSRTNASEDNVAYLLNVEGGQKKEVEAAARDIGTSVKVENLFFNIPARRKFLKTAETEYRKILQTFFSISMINPSIHFVLENDGKMVYNLPAVKSTATSSVHPQRISSILKGYEFLDVFFEGEGIVVGGLVAHPKYNVSKSSNQYIFVNGRPIWDNGIAKSVQIGVNRFIPEGKKIPFAISLKLRPEIVDVNVHPRKSEVRFANPYRVYSAVEKAIKEKFQSSLSKGESDLNDDYYRLRKSGVQSQFENNENQHDEFNASDQVSRFSRVKRIRTNRYSEIGQGLANESGNVDDSISFSKLLLDSTQDYTANELQDSGNNLKNNEYPEADDSFNLTAMGNRKEFSDDMQFYVRQYLGRYLVAEVNSELWIVDQHAAAERIRFEKLISEYNQKEIEIQGFLVPVELEISEQEMSFIKENEKVFTNLGFNLEHRTDKINLLGIPSILSEGDAKQIFMDILSEIMDLEEIEAKESVFSGKYRDSLLATMACHSSVRMNQRVSDAEAKNLIGELLKCKNSYSCPHGRPIVWRLTPKEIDGHFDRMK